MRQVSRERRRSIRRTSEGEGSVLTKRESHEHLGSGGNNEERRGDGTYGEGEGRVLLGEGRGNLWRKRMDVGSYSDCRRNRSRDWKVVKKEKCCLGSCLCCLDVVKCFWKGVGWRGLRNQVFFYVRKGDRCPKNRGGGACRIECGKRC